MIGELHVQEEPAVSDGAPSCVVPLKDTFWAGAENGFGLGRGKGHTSA